MSTMATGNNMKVLAVKEVKDLGGYMVRARFDGLIRYFSVTDEAASKFPPDWKEPGGTGPPIPPGVPADLKCFHLRLPDDGDYYIQLREDIDYPVDDVLDDPIPPPYDLIMVPLNQELIGIDNTGGWATFDYDDLVQYEKVASLRFEHRLCEDRMRVVRLPSHLTPASASGSGGDGSSPRMLMKIVEFPDTWPGHSTSSSPPAPPALVNLISSFESGSPSREVEMHQQIAAALTAADDDDNGKNKRLVPAFYGAVTERGRGVVGFLSEYVEGAQTFSQIFAAAAAADPAWQLGEADRDACRDALRRLHAAGFAHGDAHAANFLRRRDDGSVVIIDFERAVRLPDDENDAGAQRAMRLADVELLELWLARTAGEFLGYFSVHSSDPSGHHASGSSTSRVHPQLFYASPEIFEPE